ncbi:MAG: hypothetical protein WC700_10105 [Gemmatimonadaceae bacterium]
MIAAIRRNRDPKIIIQCRLWGATTLKVALSAAQTNEFNRLHVQEQKSSPDAKANAIRLTRMIQEWTNKSGSAMDYDIGIVEAAYDQNLLAVTHCRLWGATNLGAAVAAAREVGNESLAKTIESWTL